MSILSSGHGVSAPRYAPEMRGFPAVRRTADAQPQPVESIVMSCALWHA
ncbi:hypothetical protein M2390_002330 [Mycetocola sp. BIGb0189]|nr:hypothetical protein [Mycetocola sp. BIGb0189]